MISSELLKVDNLSIKFTTEDGVIPVVNQVSFSLCRGETLALVGESGSGKSVTSLGIMRLIPNPRSCTITGRVLLYEKDGRERDLLAIAETDMRAIRGDRISMIFQEPMTSLNPVHSIGDQIVESIKLHRKVNRSQARSSAAELLELVGIPEPQKRLRDFPHQFSGGMRQRVMIAIALACDPNILIADEPTTALDVTIQAQILDLLKRLQAETGMSIVFITHNLGVVAEIADRVMVMYTGRIMEQADTRDLFKKPLMPYTQGLLDSVPRFVQRFGKPSPLAAIPGTVPEPARMPTGCPFHPRCQHAEAGRCDNNWPELEEAAHRHLVRCLRWRELKAGA